MSSTIWDIAHLGHVEVFTPKLQESTGFFTEILGMYISAETANSVYLRAYDDYEHHTLKLTAHAHAGIGHYGWRVRSEEILQKKQGKLPPPPTQLAGRKVI